MYEISCCNDFPWLFIWNGKHSERISKLDIKFDKKIFLIFFQQKDENKDSKANSYDSNDHEENGNGNVNKNGLDQPENGFR